MVTMDLLQAFQVTALRNMRDLDFDLSMVTPGQSQCRHLKEHQTSSHSTLICNYGPICKRFQNSPPKYAGTSPGHSRSKPMAPFERASMTSYSTLMVTMDLLSVSKLQPSVAWPRFWPLRSLQVKANAAIWKSIHDFLFNFNGKYGPICKRFEVTALRNMRDLDFDLSRSFQVKANAAFWKSIYDFLFNFNGNYGPICKLFQVTALWNMLEMCPRFDLSGSL